MEKVSLISYFLSALCKNSNIHYSRSKINQKISESGSLVYMLGILDGLHRCYSFTTLLKQKGSWEKLLASEQKIVLKYFVLKNEHLPEMIADEQLSCSLLTLCREYSYQLMTMRKNTVDHTLLDALHKCFKEVTDNTDMGRFRYIAGTTVQRKKKNGSDVTSLHVLASKNNERKEVLNKNLLPYLQSIFKHLCESDAYFECVRKGFASQNTITKEVFSKKIDFKKMKVSFVCFS